MAIYKLIKKIVRKDGQGNVYKVLPVGQEVNVDKIEAARLMREGYIEDPEMAEIPTKFKKKPKKQTDIEADDLGELKTDKDE